MSKRYIFLGDAVLTNNFPRIKISGQTEIPIYPRKMCSMHITALSDHVTSYIYIAIIIVLASRLQERRRLVPLTMQILA